MPLTLVLRLITRITQCLESEVYSLDLSYRSGLKYYSRSKHSFHFMHISLVVRIHALQKPYQLYYLYKS